jgi:hypothetical protein
MTRAWPSSEDGGMTFQIAPRGRRTAANPTLLARGHRSPRLYAPERLRRLAKNHTAKILDRHLGALEIYDAADVGINGREVVAQANLKGASGCFAKTRLAAGADSKPKADRHSAPLPVLVFLAFCT